MTLTNPRNPHLKQARKLQQRKERDETGLFVVEGIRHVGEAVEAGAALQYICYAPDLLESQFARDLIAQQAARGLHCYALAPDVFRSLAEKDNPQGILAVVRQPRFQLAEFTADKFPWVVALVSPQDPGNIGAVLRTMDAVGAKGLVLLDGGADPYHPNAVRASLGALFWMPVVSTTFAEFTTWVGAQSYTLFGTSARGTDDYRTVTYPRPCVLLLGSEQKGLLPAQAVACHQLVRVPMQGKVTSLNLAVAAGVVLYAMGAGGEQ